MCGLYTREINLNPYFLYSQCRNRNRDGETNRKKKTGLKRDWSRHHSYFWKTMENHKNKASLQKTRFLDPGVGYT